MSDKRAGWLAFAVWLAFGMALITGMCVLGMVYERPWEPLGSPVYTRPAALVDALFALFVAHAAAGCLLRRWRGCALAALVVLLPLTMIIWAFAKTLITDGLAPL